MALNKIRVNICESDYLLSTPEEEGYVRMLAARLDKDMNDTLAMSDRISVTSAAVLAAMDYLDQLTKAQETADNMRLQIKDYLEDSAKSRIECEEAKREAERLKQQVVSLKTKLEMQ